ncbi:MAG: Queuine tRNA-ribosyltransferase [Planctomycetes bacterium ADurb.Bin401]|nr:MAG: Queuine tRNA-ribosyltransferase [Planctomycetes bacterium ADurb.Bin401]
MNIFETLKKDPNSRARTGLLNTFHGQIKTPVFMPVGTRATVKGILPKDLQEAGSQIILGNTFHLMLRPGADVIQKIGGLHRFMSWNKPILTDSGGFQVFSLSEINTITDDGAEFYSPYDGAKIYLDAARATEIQNKLGADIIMCFDQCPAYNAPQNEQEKAVQRTIRWAKICKEAHSNDRQLLFGIVQGQTDNNLRQNCAQELIKLDFPGYALGGLSVGEGTAQMLSTVRFAAPLLPENKPRYLMGVGTPADLIQAVEAGMDMFDCVMPTRNGRNALAFTSAGPIRLRNAAFIDDEKPIDLQCQCYCCQNFTRSAIRHFFNVGEMLGPILLSLHNIVFYHNLMDKIQKNIENGTFANWASHALQSAAYARSQATDENETK